MAIQSGVTTAVVVLVVIALLFGGTAGGLLGSRELFNQSAAAVTKAQGEEEVRHSAQMNRLAEEKEAQRAEAEAVRTSVLAQQQIEFEPTRLLIDNIGKWLLLLFLVMPFAFWLTAKAVREWRSISVQPAVLSRAERARMSYLERTGRNNGHGKPDQPASAFGVGLRSEFKSGTM